MRDTEFFIIVHADHKLESLQPYPIEHYRRKQGAESLNAIELSTYRSINRSMVWIGVAASHFGSFASSYLQQKLPNVTVCDIVAQAHMLRELKKKLDKQLLLRVPLI